MLTDRPGLTTATAASAAAEPLLFSSSLLSIILLLTPCTFNQFFSPSVSLPPLSDYLFLTCTIFLSFLRPTLDKLELHSQC